jgi:hypothetical protein
VRRVLAVALKTVGLNADGQQPGSGFGEPRNAKEAEYVRGPEGTRVCRARRALFRDGCAV